MEGNLGQPSVLSFKESANNYIGNYPGKESREVEAEEIQEASRKATRGGGDGHDIYFCRAELILPPRLGLSSLFLRDTATHAFGT